MSGTKELEDKALQVVQEEENKPYDKELARLFKDEFNVSNRNQIAFCVEYVKNGGNATRAYKKIYNEYMNDHTACVLGSKILRKIDIGLLLDFMGHGIDQIDQAMNKLLEKDPASYMKYQTTLRRWDIQRIEHSGDLTIKYEQEFDS